MEASESIFAKLHAAKTKAKLFPVNDGGELREDHCAGKVLNYKAQAREFSVEFLIDLGVMYS